MVNDAPTQPTFHRNTVINRTVGGGFASDFATDEEPNEYMGLYVACSDGDSENERPLDSFALLWLDEDDTRLRPRPPPQYAMRSSNLNTFDTFHQQANRNIDRIDCTQANQDAMQNLINTHRTLLDTPFEHVDWSRLQANPTDIQFRPRSRKRTLEEAFPGITDAENSHIRMVYS